ncbi:MAG: ATP-binding cassette domain-containing protein, partial [Spirochaetaceae bacterium]
MPENNVLLEMKNITKEFPGVKALSDVSFSVSRGEIHCLVGENGAGKSTLMKVLSGVYPHGSYSGEIRINGITQSFRNIADSEKQGIAVIYQELALVPDMTVYENIFLGHEIHKMQIMNWNETIKRAKAELERVRLKVNPGTKARELGVGKQQLVEIAKALSKNVKLLILDEPTAALNEGDSKNLLDLVCGLKEQGVTCVLISHKLKEVISIADTVTVLRDGKTICTLDAKKDMVNENVLIKHMVGREINNVFPERERKPAGETIFRVSNWSAYDRNIGRQILKDINFEIKKGEIVGFAGLMGSGRTELALSLFGNSPGYDCKGEIIFKTVDCSFHHTSGAIKAGIAYVTEDRKKNGLILIQDVRENITLANLGAVSRFMIIDKNKEIASSEEYRKKLDIRASSIEQTVGNLSGGNQQKVSVAKWLFAGPELLILDEPTRGIDVGAKYEIYTIMNRLVEQGLSIIMISSELPEILGMSDR